MVARYRISTTKKIARKSIFCAKSFQKTILSPNSAESTDKVLNQPECAVACCVSSPVRMAAAAAVISNMDEPFRASGGQVILTEALCPKQCRYLYQFDSACRSRAVPPFSDDCAKTSAVGQLTEKASTRRRHGLKTIKGAFCGASTTAYGCRPAGPRKRWTSWHSACPRLLSASCRA